MNQQSPSTPQPPPPPLSDEELLSLHRWIVALCVIRFDLERGQTVETCYPSPSLSQDEELQIAFSSFPDSMSQRNPDPNPTPNRSSIHDSTFFFRLRRTHHPPSHFLYGYVFNRQRQDDRLRRGGEQKSVVILSHFPYSSVFRPLLRILGPLCFDIGVRALHHVASCIASWPSPRFDCPIDLPIGAAKLKVHLPPALSFSSLSPTNQLVPQGLFHDADLFGVFRGLLLQLWTLWELVLIGEPLLVVAPTPGQCCEAVAGLVSLVAPLLYSVDFRPYFTIHDSDFSRLNSLGDHDYFPPMLLGVTNLFFLKALKNMPHVVSVGSPVKPPARSASVRRTGPLNVENLKKFSPTGLLNAVRARRDGPLCLMTEHREAIWSSYAATTKPDTSVLNRLVDVGASLRVEESMTVVNNEILRRHFLELTTNFLAPFGPYLRATTPLEGVSPFVDPPPLPPFNGDEFLSSLSDRGLGKYLSKRMRPNWLDLYRRFLEGNNFMPWFRKRREAAEQEQHRLWRQARVVADIKTFISKMSELEVVDSFNAIQRHLLAEMQLYNVPMLGGLEKGNDAHKFLDSMHKGPSFQL
ncbi:hypothetical protein QJS10_CPB19g01469 [Acorus calamus]|uniref:UDENN domain-containing protein n=1 Tax=Acorus calamus TaxID=4465 RepID=A0AAV9CGM3_ACOCL|nr:hypothetical protein QJS10_CPB19g01469 [Acorus calamus]